MDWKRVADCNNRNYSCSHAFLERNSKYQFHSLWKIKIMEREVEQRKKGFKALKDN